MSIQRRWVAEAVAISLKKTHFNICCLVPQCDQVTWPYTGKCGKSYGSEENCHDDVEDRQTALTFPRLDGEETWCFPVGVRRTAYVSVCSSLAPLEGTDVQQCSGSSSTAPTFA